jgi:hypothetical protein
VQTVIHATPELYPFAFTNHEYAHKRSGTTEITDADNETFVVPITGWVERDELFCDPAGTQAVISYI